MKTVKNSDVHKVVQLIDPKTKKVINAKVTYHGVASTGSLPEYLKDPK